MFRVNALSLLLLFSTFTVEAANSIHDLVVYNDLERVSRYIKEGGEVNQANRYDERPLHLARTPEMLKLLIKGGAEVNIENHFGDSPLLQAVYKGDHGLAE